MSYPDKLKPDLQPSPKGCNQKNVMNCLIFFLVGNNIFFFIEKCNDCVDTDEGQRLFAVAVDLDPVVFGSDQDFSPFSGSDLSDPISLKKIRIRKTLIISTI